MKKLFYLCLLSAASGALLFSGCFSSKQDDRPTKILTVKDLMAPVREDGKLLKMKPVETAWKNEGEVPPAIMQAFVDKLAGKKNNKAVITRSELRKASIIPYVLGMWTDKNFLRTPEMIGKMAEDYSILTSVKPSENIWRGWPVYHPPKQDFVRRIIRNNNQQSGIKLYVQPLPEVKPAHRSAKGYALYSQPGYLYLPNSYVAPGEKFNVMSGWDSFFIIRGILDSAEYILTHYKCKIYSNGKLRNADLDDARELFYLAKGMVDNHIYQIYFYGGFVLDANRTYCMDRSNPPMLTREAMAIHDFQRQYGKLLKLQYLETLARYFKTRYSDFVPPANYNEWITREVLPASAIYFNYWAGATTYYRGWDPIITRTKQRNPRVVYVNRAGDCRDESGIGATPACRYYTGGYGPRPELVYNTDPQAVYPYQNTAVFFRKYPKQNPLDFATGQRRFYDLESKFYAKLTRQYYAADRANQASGTAMSAKFGPEGQFICDYANLELNVLVYQMAVDVRHMLNSFITDKNEKKTVAKLIGYYDRQIKNFKYVVNDLMWVSAGKGGYFADLRIKITGNAPKHTYLSASAFWPLWAEGLITPKKKYATLNHAVVAGEVKQDEVITRRTEKKIAMRWFNDNPGWIFRYVPERNAYISDPAPKTSMINIWTVPDQRSRSYGLPTSLIESGHTWDYPFAVAPMQYFAAEGLKKLNPEKDSKIDNTLRNLLNGWIDACEIHFAETGGFAEKYSVYNPSNTAKLKNKAPSRTAWSGAMYLHALMTLEKLDKK